MKYYDIKYTLARGSTINMVIGQRGCGKTYSTTKYVYENYINKGEKFLYIRRNRNQIASAAKNFFSKYDDIKADKKEFRYKGKNMGYYCNLSEAQTLKSGFDLESVTTILFDEVNESNVERYLQGEYILFSDLLDTTLRLRTDAVVIFLGNSYSLYNPYTIQWGCSLGKSQKKWSSPDNFFRLELVTMDEITKARQESIVGRFTAGTLYADMATNNLFILDSSEMIAKRDGSYKCTWAINYNNLWFYLWHSYQANNIIIDTAGCNVNYKFTVTKSNVRAGINYLPSYPQWYMRIRKMYDRGSIYFQDARVRSQFMQVLKFI